MKRQVISDYSKYTMAPLERAFSILSAAVVIFIIAYIFYRNAVISGVLTPLALLYPRFRTGQKIKKRRNELNMQFKDMLYSLSSSLSAGRPLETAFRDVLKDLSVIYPAPETLIIVETELMARKLEMNENLEEALADFSKRAHIDDIENFTDVLRTCKRTGGNIVEVIRNTSSIINDKIEVRQEIDMLLAQRKFEQKVLNVMPVFMVVLLSLSAPDYMAPVFTTITGKIVMSVSLMLLAAAYFISAKIIDIGI